MIFKEIKKDPIDPTNPKYKSQLLNCVWLPDLKVEPKANYKHIKGGSLTTRTSFPLISKSERNYKGEYLEKIHKAFVNQPVARLPNLQISSDKNWELAKIEARKDSYAKLIKVMMDRGEKLHVPLVSLMEEIPVSEQSLQETFTPEIELEKPTHDSTNDEVLDRVMLFLQSNPYKPMNQKSEKDFLLDHILGKPRVSGTEFNHAFSEIESLGNYSKKLDFALKEEDDEFNVSYERNAADNQSKFISEISKSKSSTSLSPTSAAVHVIKVKNTPMRAEKSTFLKHQIQLHESLLKQLRLREHLKLMSCSTASSVGLIEKRVLGNIMKREKLQRANNIWNEEKFNLDV